MRARTKRRIRSTRANSILPTASKPSSGQVQIDAVEISPNTVLPNGMVTVNVALQETAQFALSGTCVPSGIATSTGLVTDVTVNPTWTDKDFQQVCVPMWITMDGRKEIQFRFRAPDEVGDQQIQVSIQTQNNNMGTTTRQIKVAGSDDGGEAGCETDSDCPSGTHCKGGECVPKGDDNGGGGGDNIVQDATNLIMVGAGAYVLFKVGEAVTD